MTSSPSGEEGCAFCAIVQGHAPARVVWRSEDVIAFLPDAPAVAGHTLVVPTWHVRDIWDVDSSLGRKLAHATSRVAEGVASAAGTRQINIIQSNGPAAGQTVFHLHVHVVPREPGDRMPEMWPPDADWSPNNLDQMAADLRAAFAGSKGN
ncbi:HIT domain-containing protein (plasmid) [Arthrobacter sp. YA7-1]|uniref:HIT family protein n=1 Tax=Arthrobacter sp. YA7-1 TaxID=2987701 RepID=UPI002226941E|nr:HIT domain-containing protein [Arthrobacter sp. YA7-1]UYY83677.1 HIT domain-containing protein [Arthrobacter sp. YA7-1]